MLLLKVLSSNRKNRNFKETTFMIPIPFIIDGEVKELLLYVNKDENTNSNKFTFTAYDNNKELCEIKISKYNEEKYLLSIILFDKKLYNRCNKEEINELLRSFENIETEINYAGKNNE